MILDANGDPLEAIAAEFQSVGDPMAAGGRYEQIVGMGSDLRFLTYFTRRADRCQACDSQARDPTRGKAHE